MKTASKKKRTNQEKLKRNKQICNEIVLDMDLSHRKDGDKIKSLCCDIIRLCNKKIRNTPRTKNVV